MKKAMRLNSRRAKRIAKCVSKLSSALLKANAAIQQAGFATGALKLVVPDAFKDELNSYATLVGKTLANDLEMYRVALQPDKRIRLANVEIVAASQLCPAETRATGLQDEIEASEREEDDNPAQRPAEPDTEQARIEWQDRLRSALKNPAVSILSIHPHYEAILPLTSGEVIRLCGHDPESAARGLMQVM